MTRPLAGCDAAAAEQAESDRESGPDATAVDIDTYLVLSGGFGQHQRKQTLLCSAFFVMSSATLLLPNFLWPVLRDTWPWLSDTDTATLDSAFFVGFTLGLIAAGPLGDQYGRLRIVRASFVLHILAAAATFLCDSFSSLLVVRFVVAIGVAGQINTAFLLALEICAPADRMTSKTLLTVVGWESGAFWLVGIAWLLRDHKPSWRVMVLYLLPAPLALVACSRLHESPRWLLTQGRHAEAELILKRIAAANGAYLTTALRPVDAPDANGSGGGGMGSLARRVLQLLRPSLRRRTALISFAWFGSTCSYYGVALMPPPFGTVDLYTQQLLSVVVELPAYLLMPVLGNRLGRRRAWACYLTVAALPLLLLFALPSQPDGVIITLALFARFGAAGASTICYVACAEQFPSTLRSSGTGFCNSCGRLGTILSPFVRLAGPQLRLLLLGGVCLLSALAATLLPETVGKTVAETHEPAQGLGASAPSEGEAAAAPSCHVAPQSDVSG